jgi:uncharacterized membrane protein YhaH (DUF805 family)
MELTMTDQNPYTTPEASLVVDTADTYQPVIFSFSGRLGRLRYLAYLTGLYLVTGLVLLPIMGGISAASAGTQDIGVFAILLMSVAYIAMLVFVLTFGKRRLNDVDKSGWWMLLFFVPIANLIMSLYMMFAPGTNGANNYGPAPTENPLGVKILGLFFPIISLIGIVAAIVIPALNQPPM